MDYLDNDVKAEFKKRRTTQFLITIPVILVVLPMIMLERSGGNEIWGIPASVISVVALITIFIVVVVSLFNWRCPKCKRYLGKRINPKFCSRCGSELR